MSLTPPIKISGLPAHQNGQILMDFYSIRVKMKLLKIVNATEQLRRSNLIPLLQLCGVILSLLLFLTTENIVASQSTLTGGQNRPQYIQTFGI